MHYDRGAVLEAEGTAARLFGYIESGSIHYLVRNYEGGESTVESVAAGDLVGNYPYCLDGDAAPTARERYDLLLQRCPGIVKHLDLQDIASFLRSTSGRFAQQRTSIQDHQQDTPRHHV